MAVMTCREIIRRVRSLGDPAAAAGMARYGIKATNLLGVSIPKLRALARECGRNHALALELWATGIHEARILASMVDVPGEVGSGQMDRWARGFVSWDVCDQCCNNLFGYTPFAWEKAVRWADRKGEFVRRAGFVMMAVLAVHDKAAGDRAFAALMPVIERHAVDERNFVRKAVNWALRQIGKRNERLRRMAIRTAERIRRIDSRSARWIASDALAELSSGAVMRRTR